MKLSNLLLCICLLKVSNWDIVEGCGVCLHLIIKTIERRHIVLFLCLCCWLALSFALCSGVSVVGFELVNIKCLLANVISQINQCNLRLASSVNSIQNCYYSRLSLNFTFWLSLRTRCAWIFNFISFASFSHIVLLICYSSRCIFL